MATVSISAAEMFEMLAVMHLHSDWSMRGESKPQIGQAISRLQRMSKQEWSEFLHFAELQRVYLRTLRLLEKWSAVGAFTPPFDYLHDLEQREHRQVEDALTALNSVARALDLTGHTPLVIKTLDHWPDIGSDLDLFINASQHDTVRAMRSELQAEPQEQSWGDRLAHKWNFKIPGQGRLAEIHVGCLGQTGEQDELPALLEQTSVVRDVGPFHFRVPSPEEQVTLATLQRMYRHFYIRFTDLLNLTALVRAGRLDFAKLRASTERWAIWPGVATLLKITSDYNARVGDGPLSLPDLVLRSARFGAEKTYVGKYFLRVPMMPQGSQLFLQQLIGTGTARRFRSAARLSLLPALAVAAFVNLKFTGDDKGIW
ncbi:MAG TPA: hypothetical protein VH350_02500 [Candidatus Sulfotelmatobacter sp.]|nr:hypothetical protein [Candidatus Sulfotelmatobacter sp.]